LPISRISKTAEISSAARSERYRPEPDGTSIELHGLPRRVNTGVLQMPPHVPLVAVVFHVSIALRPAQTRQQARFDSVHANRSAISSYAMPVGKNARALWRITPACPCAVRFCLMTQPFAIPGQRPAQNRRPHLNEYIECFLQRAPQPLPVPRSESTAYGITMPKFRRIWFDISRRSECSSSHHPNPRNGSFEGLSNLTSKLTF
jgi:hypothetical protein